MQATEPVFTVSTIVEVPEDLHTSMKEFLKDNPAWDADRVMRGALSLFLLQNRNPSLGFEQEASQRRAARYYLDTLFGGPA